MVSKPKQKEMIELIIYLVVAFVVFYFMYHRFKDRVKKKLENNYYLYFYDTSEFWIIIFICLLWPVSLTGIVIWKLLDKLTGRSK